MSRYCGMWHHASEDHGTSCAPGNQLVQRDQKLARAFHFHAIAGGPPAD